MLFCGKEESDMAKRIITISREFGSGGRFIGEEVAKKLITMAAPMVLSMLIGALYNVVDSLFVSHYGENALSAVSLAFPMMN